MVSLLDFIVMLILVGLVSIVIFLAIIPTMPLAGAVVRLRANYNPQGLRLDPEARERPRTHPIITFFAMLARVYRIEGWSGLYKGFMPTFLSIPVFAALFLLRSMGTGNLRIDKYDPISIGVMGSLGYALLALISLPLMIVIDRAITTPFKLPYFDPMRSLRILLTHSERQNPLILYQTPGLVAAKFLQITLIVLGLGTVRRFLLPEPTQHDSLPSKDIPTSNLGISFILALAGTVALTPLEVISTRLALQRNYAAPSPILVSQEDAVQETVEHAGADEDVISLRTKQERYTGLIDCAKKIIEEEGWCALYRAWWWTMLARAFI